MLKETLPDVRVEAGLASCLHEGAFSCGTGFERGLAPLLIVKTGASRIVRLRCPGGYPAIAANRPDACVDIVQFEVLVQLQESQTAEAAPSPGIPVIAATCGAAPGA